MSVLEVLTDDQVIAFTNQFDNVKLEKLIYKGEVIRFYEDHSHSINNQNGELREFNFLGNSQEYLVESNLESFHISLQLYKNVRNHYRLYVYENNNQMLTSTNLTKCFDGNDIDFTIQIKISSPQNRSKEERMLVRDAVVTGLSESGLPSDKKNTVSLGAYDVNEERMKNVSPTEFLEKVVLVAYAKRKELKELL